MLVISSGLHIMLGTVKSLVQIAAEYKIHPNTLRNWIKPIIPQLQLSNKRRLLLPWQVEMIHNFLGGPEEKQ